MTSTKNTTNQEASPSVNDSKQSSTVLASPKVQEVDLKKTVVKNLVMGGTAGIVGATCTYPLDLVKTTLQNQRTAKGASKMYNGVVDCFAKIVQQHGVKGLYRGLPAQLVGITPEKAIKLTMNDFLRYKFTDKETGEIKLIYEAIAGAAAGFSQVVATNPYELVKVRLQTQAGHERKSALTIIRELGFRGLTVGSGACLLRDVPFSAIYFTLYANFKKMMTDDKGHLSFINLFGSGIAAGMLSAALVTPADVVKTRLQVQARSETPKYKGISDCFVKIIQEEGPRALFKGSVPRVLIISPLFGITLLTYEVLQGFFL